MKILLLSKSYFPLVGGSINYIHNLAKSFVELGHDVTLLTRQPGSVDDQPKVNYKLIRRPNTFKKLEAAYWAEVVLQVDASWQDIWPALLFSKPWVPSVHRCFTEQDASADWKFKLRIQAEKLAYRLGQTVFVSQSVQKSWQVNGLVIPNSYDDKLFFYDARTVKENDFLFVGRITESKGVLFFLDELYKLVISRPKNFVSVAIVGSGDLEKEVEYYQSKAPRNIEVKLLGAMHPDGVAEVMKHSKTLVFPTLASWGEASPLTPLEAQACGCRVIAADNGGTYENLGENTYLFPPGDSAILYQYLEKVYMLDDLPLDSVDQSFLSNRELAKTAATYISHFKSII